MALAVVVAATSNGMQGVYRIVECKAACVALAQHQHVSRHARRCVCAIVGVVVCVCVCSDSRVGASCVG